VAKKNTYEQQAKLSVILAVAGAFLLVLVAAAILSAVDWENRWIPYSGRGKRVLAIVVGLGLSMAASGVGFLVGINSAGQRLNARSRLSWTGFFLNAAVIALGLCCAVFFFVWRLQINPVTTG
jgi:hypothetical protein